MGSGGTPALERADDRDVRGREAELAAVRNALADPGEGARTTLIEGEAGAGKSTVWAIGVEQARAVGWTVLAARGSQAETGMSFAGLTDLLDPIIDPVLDELPVPQRMAIEVALFRRAPSATHIGPREVGAATLGVLRALSRVRPLLVAVDDLPWLDGASRDALRFALRRLDTAPIQVLATRRAVGGVAEEVGQAGRGRTGTAAADADADLGTDAQSSVLRAPNPATDSFLTNAVDTLRLGPLGSDVIGRVLADRFGAGFPKAVVDRIVAQTGGNPFWALEIGAALIRDNPSRTAAAFSAVDDLPVPASLSALVAQRLDALPPPVREVMFVVSMLDQSTVAMVRQVLADSVSDPDSVIDAAIAAGVVAEAAGRLRPAHPLLGSAAVEALPPLARAARHRRLAELVADPEQRARHLLRAASGEPDAALAEALDAGSQAAGSRGAPLAAASLAERAADATPSQDPASRTRRLLSAAELAFRGGDHHAARRCALTAWQTGGKDRRHALPVLVEATWWTDGQKAAEEFVAPLAADQDLDTHTRAVVLALAADVGDGFGTPRAVLAQQALDLFEQVGAAADGAALSTALLYLAFARLESGDGIAFDLMGRIEEIQRGLPYVVGNNRARNVLACWHKDVDDLDASRTGLLAALAEAHDQGEEAVLASLYGHLALTEVWAGRFAAARDALTRAVARHPGETGVPTALTGADALLTLLTGDIATTRPLILETLGGGPLFAGLRGFAALLAGDDAAVADELGRAYADAQRTGHREPGRRGRIEGNLGQALAGLGRLDEAQALAEEQLELGRRGARPTLIGIGHRLEGLVFAARGDLDRAAMSLETAVAEHERSQFRLELGRSLLTLGQVQRRRKARGPAREALQAALDLFTALGATPFVQLTHAELTKGRRSASATELTASERQVADLVASGMTNREVAARLFTSVRTVETHLASIYRKLDVRSRSGLAARWARDRDRDE